MTLSLWQLSSWNRELRPGDWGPSEHFSSDFTFCLITPSREILFPLWWHFSSCRVVIRDCPSTFSSPCCLLETVAQEHITTGDCIFKLILNQSQTFTGYKRLSGYKTLLCLLTLAVLFRFFISHIQTVTLSWELKNNQSKESRLWMCISV